MRKAEREKGKQPFATVIRLGLSVWCMGLATCSFCAPAADAGTVEVRKREIVVSVIGLPPPSFPPVAESVPKVIGYWIDAIDREIGNQPDLVVLPEVCDVVPTKDAAEKAAWIRMRGTAVLEALKGYAAKHRCYIVYSSYRERSDDRFSNSSQLIDRSGSVVACYDKVFPTVGEAGDADCPIVPGRDAVVVETDFGRVGFVICFDLNFPELRQMYAEKCPDIMCFSSYFDGDFQQRVWARECRSYVVSATSANWLEKQVVDPAGGVLCCENYYMPTFSVRLNTNCKVLHLDYNRAKFPAVVKKYGRRVTFRNAGRVGTVTLVSNDPTLPVEEIIREFALETFDDYMDRSLRVRESVLLNVNRPRAVVPAIPDAEWTKSWWMDRHLQKLELSKKGPWDLVFIGDSITHNWECLATNSWARHYGGGAIRALNLGFRGDRTEHVLWRLEHGELGGFSAKCIVLMIGTNNTGHFSPADESPSDTELGIRTILTEIRRWQPEARVVLTAIFPRGADATDPNRLRNDEVNRRIRSLADGKRVFWMDLTAEILSEDRVLPKSEFPDLLHPGERTYEKWALALKPFCLLDCKEER